MTDQTDTSAADRRAVSYYQLPGAGRTWLDTRDRYDELTQRDLSVRSRAILVARGEYDPAKRGSDDPAPLTLRERLEVLANGEVVARVYRHPYQVHRALEAGATWEQIADATGATGTNAERLPKLRQEYREFAEGQHQLWVDEPGAGRFGMNDDEYAAAIARAGTEPVSHAHSRPEMVTVPQGDLRLAVSALRDLAAHGAEPLGDFAGRLAETAGLTVPVPDLEAGQ